MSADPLTADERLALEHMELRLLLELERDQDLDKAVKSFANLFQEIGQAYENKTVSTLYTRRMFNFLAGHYWDLLQFWIETYRERNDATLYSRFEFLAKTLREVAAIDEPSGGSASPKQGFGLLDRDAILREATQPCRYFIFGYGSLVNSTSREHVVGKCEVLAASLLGYERRWHAVEHIRLLEVEPPQVRPALFLDVALSKDGVCNGVLIPIDKAARFRDMDRREKNYVRIDVTQWIQPRSRELPPAARVYTYVGRPQFALPPYGTFNPTATPTEPGDAVGELCVPGDYLRLIEDGLKEWDDAFVRQFRDNTRTRPDVPVVEGRYQFLNPEQNLTTGR